MTPVSVFVAMRFMWEQRSQNVLMISGVGVGVGVLVFISALIGGMQEMLIERTTGTQAHVVVSPLELDGRPVLGSSDDDVVYARRIERPIQHLDTLPEWQKVDRNLAAAGAAATAPIAAGPAIAVRGATDCAVSILGAEAERLDQVIAVTRSVVAGSYAVAGADIVLGIDLAKDLGVGLGNHVRIRTGRSDGQMFVVSGLVDMGNHVLNKTWVLMSMRNAQTLLGVGGAATAIYVRVHDIYEADRVAKRIERITGLTAKSWMDTNAQLLSALRTQSASTTMIRFFVLVSVAIGIASVLAVSVIQRQREIGILRAMGVTRGGILRIFLLEGAVIGLVGSAIGCAVGAGLSLGFGAALKNPDGTPFFSFALTPALFVTAAGIAVVTGLVAAFVPARRASRLDPAEAMRHG